MLATTHQGSVCLTLSTFSSLFLILARNHAGVVNGERDKGLTFQVGCGHLMTLDTCTVAVFFLFYLFLCCVDGTMCAYVCTFILQVGDMDLLRSVRCWQAGHVCRLVLCGVAKGGVLSTQYNFPRTKDGLILVCLIKS
ncbi:hypothetical protein GGP41_002648 [Bipolaris sorokiniana]|uniref:Uncharacterized protein n=1 Tax=Cochliobolus sativus TaxID=45130 RepID=A0A8H5ZJT0_COCSA|nr:hypothetical protein GGP41_002648 [Bipolaris sorokiniana]